LLRGAARFFAAGAVTACCGFMAVSPELMTLLASPEVAAAAPQVLGPVLAGILIWALGMFHVQVLHGLRRPGMISLATLGAAAVNVPLTILLVTAVGIVGAAVATALAYAAGFVLLARCSATRLLNPSESALLATAFGACFLAGGLGWPLAARLLVGGLALAVIGAALVRSGSLNLVRGQAALLVPTTEDGDRT
jgi:O-antigen/teichoic acid export membrane protein